MFIFFMTKQIEWDDLPGPPWPKYKLDQAASIARSVFDKGSGKLQRISYNDERWEKAVGISECVDERSAVSAALFHESFHLWNPTSKYSMLGGIEKYSSELGEIDILTTVFQSVRLGVKCSVSRINQLWSRASLGFYVSSAGIDDQCSLDPYDRNNNVESYRLTGNTQVAEEYMNNFLEIAAERKDELYKLALDRLKPHEQHLHEGVIDILQAFGKKGK